MALAIVKQSSCVELDGQVRPPQERWGNVSASRADPRSAEDFLNGVGTLNPSEKCVSPSEKGNYRSFLTLARSPSYRALWRDGSGDQRTDKLDHQDRANEEEEGGTPRVLRGAP